MPLVIEDIEIQRVAIADDAPGNRATLSEELRDIELDPVSLDGPFNNAHDLAQASIEKSEALICDQRLNQFNYANCRGAEVVALCYDQHFPAVLVTRYSGTDIDEIRPYLPRIPALLSSSEANPDSIAQGFERAILEMRDYYTVTRKPWNTLIRIDEVETKGPNLHFVYATVPAWNPKEGVRFLASIVPANLREYLRPNARFFAKVNIGAEAQEQLYFKDFEYRG